VLAVTVLTSSMLWPQGHLQSYILLGIGVVGIAYLCIFTWVIIPSASYRQSHSWLNALLTSAGLCVLTYAVPGRLDLYVGVLLILAVISSSIYSERGPAYLMIVLTTAITFWIRRSPRVDIAFEYGGHCGHYCGDRSAAQESVPGPYPQARDDH